MRIRRKATHIKNRICCNCMKPIEKSRNVGAKYCKICGRVASSGSFERSNQLLDIRINSGYLTTTDTVELITNTDLSQPPISDPEEREKLILITN